MDLECIFDTHIEPTCSDEHPRVLVLNIILPGGNMISLRLIPSEAKELHEVIGKEIPYMEED